MEKNKLIPITKVVIPDNLINDLYTQLRNIVGDQRITYVNIVNILLSLMQIVETYKNVTGEQKKELVLTSLNLFIDKDFNYNVAARKEIKELVKSMLPEVIDMFIKLNNKEVRISIKKSFMRIFKCCKN